MKLDSDIKELVKGVFSGCGILCVIEIAAGIVLYAAGLFDLKATPASVTGVILGAAGGTLVAALVFLWMAVSLQKTLDKAALGGAAVKRGVQAGYTQRLLAQGAWVVIAVLVPYINTVCGLIPLLFPKLSIYLLQITGKLNLTQKGQTTQTTQQAVKTEDADIASAAAETTDAEKAETSSETEAAGESEEKPGDKGGEN